MATNWPVGAWTNSLTGIPSATTQTPFGLPSYSTVNLPVVCNSSIYPGLSWISSNSLNTATKTSFGSNNLFKSVLQNGLPKSSSGTLHLSPTFPHHPLLIQ